MLCSTSSIFPFLDETDPQALSLGLSTEVRAKFCSPDRMKEKQDFPEDARIRTEKKGKRKGELGGKGQKKKRKKE
jgi:hypothetical protein